ncbi:MAG: cell division protein FtsL [Pseudomonadota bacterium]
MNGRPALLTLVLAFVCVISALALVYTRHQSRELFVELETLRTDSDELNIEYGQLQLEQSARAALSEIEEFASDELSLERPESRDITVIEQQ